MSGRRRLATGISKIFMIIKNLEIPPSLTAESNDFETANTFINFLFTEATESLL